MNVGTIASRLAAGDVGGIAAFLAAFAGGLVAGLGPCVLPTLPAVFGYVTGTVSCDPAGEPPKVRLGLGLGLSAVFVLGMSLVFVAIGALAAVVGHALMFGTWAHYLVAAACVAIAFQMLGIVDLRVDRLNRVLPTHRPPYRGFAGALLFGMLFGLVASPCSTPVLAAIATIAATTGSAVRGGALLFVYGLGKGVPPLALGIASGSFGVMRRMPGATPWLTRLGGAGLLGAAAYLSWTA